MRVLGGGRVPPALHLVMQAPPAPCVAEAGPESQQQEVVEQRLRYHEKQTHATNMHTVKSDSILRQCLQQMTIVV